QSRVESCPQPVRGVLPRTPRHHLIIMTTPPTYTDTLTAPSARSSVTSELVPRGGAGLQRMDVIGTATDPGRVGRQDRREVAFGEPAEHRRMPERPVHPLCTVKAG